MAKVSPLLLIPPLAFAALGVVFYIGLGSAGDQQLPSALIGQPAPAAELQPLGDLPPLPENLADGRVKLVNFWASWCAPCRVEHPHLSALAAEGVPIYGVNYKDPPRNAVAFLDELGNPYEAVAADPQARMGLEWGVYGVPETFVVDGEGRITYRFAGPVTQREIGGLREAIEAAGG
ncbi:DsbE family thiol:disulfide interchange protein [Paracoccus sp. S-4012]|uniref:DsbE family thiol:disulfide interchange protein n=1 Tax=Paracoccus sp. S-4012 TaxID=2665648 RepID=UPI0012AFDB68|nr:DsbE family thiol:disulfide interchange protein [Paracoccus sp. S-4012]MRX49411.1 DsbE family thiol:disulfide interchange protein [Paracoccus sp. S-4012]